MFALSFARQMSDALKTTPLHALHLKLGARMVPFAGYSMPVQYPAGLSAEHKHCRSAATLFDVSHMGQLQVSGDSAGLALETLVPVDVAGLAPGRQRYALFTNDAGGILDDLMITRRATADGSEAYHVVVNASRKDDDTAHMQSSIGSRCSIDAMPDAALLALQGPKAAAVLSALNPAVAELVFMSGGDFDLAGVRCHVTRSGYTGEDGYEISVPGDAAVALAEALLADTRVAPAGLGARDTLRLEAGLCLYGNDIDVSTTPIEAGLNWAIQKVRRPGGARAGGYPGAAVIEQQLADGAARKRVGLVGVERAPVRAGTAIVDESGTPLGTVTSGTLAPSVDRAIAMAYVPAAQAIVGSTVYAEVRGKRLPMQVAAMPFNPHRYYRG